MEKSVSLVGAGTSNERHTNVGILLIDVRMSQPGMFNTPNQGTLVKFECMRVEGRHGGVAILGNVSISDFFLSFV